jgi:hypothetical protein
MYNPLDKLLLRLAKELLRPTRTIISANTQEFIFTPLLSQGPTHPDAMLEFISTFGCDSRIGACCAIPFILDGTCVLLVSVRCLREMIRVLTSKHSVLRRHISAFGTTLSDIGIKINQETQLKIRQECFQNSEGAFDNEIIVLPSQLIMNCTVDFVDFKKLSDIRVPQVSWGSEQFMLPLSRTVMESPAWVDFFKILGKPYVRGNHVGFGWNPLPIPARSHDRIIHDDVYLKREIGKFEFLYRSKYPLPLIRLDGHKDNPFTHIVVRMKRSVGQYNSPLHCILNDTHFARTLWNGDSWEIGEVDKLLTNVELLGGIKRWFALDPHAEVLARDFVNYKLDLKPPHECVNDISIYEILKKARTFDKYRSDSD